MNNKKSPDTIKIPSFDPSMDLDSWFKVLEHEFKRSDYTEDYKKYEYVLGLLSSDHAQTVMHVILRPPKTDRYQHLKTELIRVYSGKKEESESVEKQNSQSPRSADEPPATVVEVVLVEDHNQHNPGTSGDSPATVVDVLSAEEQQQAKLKNDIEITDIPEGHNENTIEVVLNLSSQLNVKIKEGDIVNAERDPLQQTRPRRIIARLAKYSIKEKLIRNARDTHRRDISCTIPGTNKLFFVNERLTDSKRKLFYRARRESKRAGWRFVWSDKGSIYARQNFDTERRRIKTEADLKKIFLK